MLIFEIQKVFINNKWQSRYLKFKKKENIGNFNTFQEKFIILCNNGYKI